MKSIYIVTGAAGHLGSTILELLVDRGERVFALLLAGQEPKLRHPAIRYFTGDVCDIESLRPMFEAADGAVTVIHTAARISIARRIQKGVREVNVAGTQNIIALCRKYAVRRLVHVSSVHAIPELPKNKVITEVDSLSAKSVVGGYAKTKAEAAQAVYEAAAEGLDAVVVFPSGILGPNDRGENHLVQLMLDYMRGKLLASVHGGYDFVDVRDVAEGCLRAADYGVRGEGYILSGHYASIKELLSMAAPLCGGKRIPTLPIWLAKLGIPFVELYAKLRRRRPLYTSYSLYTLSSNARFRSAKAREQIGYRPRALRETVSDMIHWLREGR